MDCIFCKLANGEIPTATLYEDDEFRVILDQGPATKGHALILPKQHFANIYERFIPMASIWYRTMVRQQDRRYSTSICI